MLAARVAIVGSAGPCSESPDVLRYVVLEAVKNDSDLVMVNVLSRIC